MAFSLRNLFGIENKAAPVQPSAFFHGIPGWAVTDGVRFTQTEITTSVRPHGMTVISSHAMCKMDRIKDI